MDSLDLPQIWVMVPPMPTKTDAALHVKKIFSDHLRNRLAAQKLSIRRFAKETKTGRSAIQRLLDPKNTSISLHTMARTATALNLELSIKVKPLPIPKLMNIVDQGLKTKTRQQAEALEAQFLAGYYGREIKKSHAKASKVLAPA
jgi:transcriptional regulator with XRE-family HTH domain